MLPFKTIIQLQKNTDTPLCLQIANALTIEIKKGMIKPGTKLPGTRMLAGLLEVHRKTVVAAFDELDAQGWIETIPSKGTFVSQMLPEVAPIDLKAPQQKAHFPAKTGYLLVPNLILDKPILANKGLLSINDGFPDERLAPIYSLNRAYRSIMKRSIHKHYLSYSDVQGNHMLRSVLSEYLNQSRGLQTSSENIFITRGSQMGIYLAIQVLISRGDVVVVGETNYSVADMGFRQAGARLVRVPVDDFGIDVDWIEEICRQQKIRVVFVTSHHHHPTTVTLRADRRIKLLSLAAAYRFAIIEDDYDYDFHYNSGPILPLASADKEGMVIYIGSLCKAIAPAIRVGYMVGPQNLIHEVSKLRRIIDRQGDPILEQAVAELFKEGDIKRHMKKALKTYYERRDVFCEILKEQLGSEIDFNIPDGGMAIWGKFDKNIKLPEVAAKALKKGLFISNGTIYNPENINLNATRMGFASLQPDEIEKAINLLTKIIKN